MHLQMAFAFDKTIYCMLLLHYSLGLSLNIFNTTSREQRRSALRNLTAGLTCYIFHDERVTSFFFFSSDDSDIQRTCKGWPVAWSAEIICHLCVISAAPVWDCQPDIGRRTEQIFILSCFPTADVCSSHSTLSSRLLLQIQTYTYSHINTHTHIHTNALWAEAAAGGKEVILEAEPDTAELCFGNISGLQILNHSLSPLSSCLLYDSLIIYFISLCLWPSPVLILALLCLFLAMRMKYVISKKTHLSVMSSQEVVEMYSLPCSSVGKQAWHCFYSMKMYYISCLIQSSVQELHGPFDYRLCPCTRMS